MQIDNLTVKINCECDTTGFDLAIKKVNEFKKVLKLSLWQIIKIKIIYRLFPFTKPKITIQELIEHDHQYKL